MITVGIHEDISLGTDMEVDERGSLGLHLVRSQGDAYEALMADDYEAADDCTLKIYSGSLLKWGTTDPKEIKTLVDEIKRTESLLKSFLNIYLTADKLKGRIGGESSFKGLGVTKDTVGGFLQNEDNLQKVYLNLFNDFVAVCKDNGLATKEEKFRIKLVRQSEAKHWPTLPKFGDFIESMNIPKEKSKIAFTKWEIDNDRNSAMEVISDTTDVKEVENADEMFDEDGGKEDVTVTKEDDIFPDDSMN